MTIKWFQQESLKQKFENIKRTFLSLLNFILVATTQAISLSSQFLLMDAKAFVLIDLDLFFELFKIVHTVFHSQILILNPLIILMEL